MIDKNHYEEYTERLEQLASKEIPYPSEKFNGKGLVFCLGGDKYFTCAWVSIQILRHLGCELPIQAWYRGKNELDQEMKDILSPYNVTFMDSEEHRIHTPARILNGYEMKPYAITHSKFAEVIFIDADNVPLVNPEFLFDTNEYADTGAIFWPDYGRLDKHRMIWEVCNIPYRDEPEFESGQIVIDKSRCWKALNLTVHMNEYSDFYYKHIHGDKDTFHMAWRKLNQQYSMPKKGIHSLAGTMCQHDFDGRRIFQHRNMRKWTLNGDNPRTPGFILEEECLSYLEQLREKWKKVKTEAFSNDEKGLYQKVVKQRYYDYVRVGYDNRSLEFAPDGRIAVGGDRLEKTWNIRKDQDKLFLEIDGSDGVICRLSKGVDGVFSGRWAQHEQMPIYLLPIEKPKLR